jgi:hypothetical protein
MEDAGDCLPVQAVHYLRGDRAGFALLNWRDRELVMMTAEKIWERIEAGLVPRDDREETGQVASEAVGDLSSMTAEQLRELARRAGQQAKLRDQAEKRKGLIVPALRSAMLDAEARHTELRAALAEAEEGRPVDLKALRVKVSRVAEQGVSAPRKTPGWTPERRARQAEIMRATLAKARQAKAKKAKAGQKVQA